MRAQGSDATPAQDSSSWHITPVARRTPSHSRQVLFELLTWRLPWTFGEMSPFKVSRRQCTLPPCMPLLHVLLAAHGQPDRDAMLHPLAHPMQVAATIRRGGRPDVPPRAALPGPDTAGWAGLEAYVQLMR